MTGRGAFEMPSLLFYVSDRAPYEGPQQLEDQLEKINVEDRRRKRDLVQPEEPGVVFRSEDGKNVLREHRIMAML